MGKCQKTIVTSELSKSKSTAEKDFTWEKTYLDELHFRHRASYIITVRKSLVIIIKKY